MSPFAFASRSLTTRQPVRTRAVAAEIPNLLRWIANRVWIVAVAVFVAATALPITAQTVASQAAAETAGPNDRTATPSQPSPDSGTAPIAVVECENSIAIEIPSAIRKVARASHRLHWQLRRHPSGVLVADGEEASIEQEIRVAVGNGPLPSGLYEARFRLVPDASRFWATLGWNHDAVLDVRQTIYALARPQPRHGDLSGASEPPRSGEPERPSEAGISSDPERSGGPSPATATGQVPQQWTAVEVIEPAAGSPLVIGSWKPSAWVGLDAEGWERLATGWRNGWQSLRRPEDLSLVRQRLDRVVRGEETYARLPSTHVFECRLPPIDGWIGRMRLEACREAPVDVLVEFLSNDNDSPIWSQRLRDEGRLGPRGLPLQRDFAWCDRGIGRLRISNLSAQHELLFAPIQLDRIEEPPLRLAADAAASDQCLIIDSRDLVFAHTNAQQANQDGEWSMPTEHWNGFVDRVDRAAAHSLMADSIPIVIRWDPEHPLSPAHLSILADRLPGCRLSVRASDLEKLNKSVGRWQDHMSLRIEIAPEGFAQANGTQFDAEAIGLDPQRIEWVVWKTEREPRLVDIDHRSADAEMQPGVLLTGGVAQTPRQAISIATRTDDSGSDLTTGGGTAGGPATVQSVQLRSLAQSDDPWEATRSSGAMQCYEVSLAEVAMSRGWPQTDATMLVSSKWSRRITERSIAPTDVAASMMDMIVWTDPQNERWIRLSNAAPWAMTVDTRFSMPTGADGVFDASMLRITGAASRVFADADHARWRIDGRGVASIGPIGDSRVQSWTAVVADGMPVVDAIQQRVTRIVERVVQLNQPPEAEDWWQSDFGPSSPNTLNANTRADSEPDRNVDPEPTLGAKETPDPVSSHSASPDPVSPPTLAPWMHAQHPAGCVQCIADPTTSPTADRVAVAKMTLDQSQRGRTWMVSPAIDVPPSGRIAVTLEAAAMPDTPRQKSPDESESNGERTQKTVKSRPESVSKTLPNVRLRIALEGDDGMEPIRLSRTIDLPADGIFRPQPMALEVVGLEPARMGTLRIALDVMSPGTVLIRQVRVHDHFAAEDERKRIQQTAFLAVQGLKRGNLTYSADLLHNRHARGLLWRSAPSQIDAPTNVGGSVGQTDVPRRSVLRPIGGPIRGDDKVERRPTRSLPREAGDEPPVPSMTQRIKRWIPAPLRF